MTKRLIVEKFISDGIKIDNKSLRYEFPNHDPKIEKKETVELLCLGGQGQPVIDLKDFDNSKRSFEQKVEELKHDKAMSELGYYTHEVLSWNEFRQWVLDRPEILDEWYDYQYGAHTRYIEQDEPILFQSVIE